MEEKGWREALEEISEKNDCYSRVEAIKTSFSRVFHTDVCLVYDVRTLLGLTDVAYLEIGSYIGFSASLIGQHPYPTYMDLVDPLSLPPTHFHGSAPQKETLMSNLMKFAPHNLVHIYQALSSDIVVKKAASSMGYDFALIDGDHSAAGVINDFNLVLRGLKLNGFIIFDDYNDHIYCPEVRPTVDMLAEMFEWDGGVSPTYKNEYIVRNTPKVDPKICVNTLTYRRLDGTSPSKLRTTFAYLRSQTSQDFDYFLYGDDYSNRSEFDQISREYSGTIFARNMNESLRHIQDDEIRWAQGGKIAYFAAIKDMISHGCDYILPLDDDDIWYPDRIKVIKDYIGKFPLAGFILSYSKYFDGYLPGGAQNVTHTYINNYTPQGADSVRTSHVYKTSACSKILLQATSPDNKNLREPNDMQILNLLRQHNIPTLLLKEVTVEKKSEHNIPVYEEGGRDTAFEI